MAETTRYLPLTRLPTSGSRRESLALSGAQRVKLVTAFKHRGGAPATESSLLGAAATASIPAIPMPTASAHATGHVAAPVDAIPRTSDASKALSCVKHAHGDVTKLASKELT